MLQLCVKSFDIIRISKLLAKYKINASITTDIILLKSGDISDELITKLCDEIEIISAQNYISEIPYETLQHDKNEFTTLQLIKKDNHHVTKIPDRMPSYDLLFPTVKRGEVYICDMGEPYGCEQGYTRYVIIVQNDMGNCSSPTTIVLSCTSEQKKFLPVHYEFKFSSENMISQTAKLNKTLTNTVLAESINTVDKSRLREFLGQMSDEFMEKLQPIIDHSLGLKHKS